MWKSTKTLTFEIPAKMNMYVVSMASSFYNSGGHHYLQIFVAPTPTDAMDLMERNNPHATGCTIGCVDITNSSIVYTRIN